MFVQLFFLSFHLKLLCVCVYGCLVGALFNFFFHGTDGVFTIYLRYNTSSSKTYQMRSNLFPLRDLKTDLCLIYEHHNTIK